MNQIEYQSYEEQDQFRPYKVADRTALIDREGSRQASADEAYARQLALNNKTKEINASKSTDNMKALSGFSETLTNYLAEETQRKNDAEMAEGIMMAYNEGLPEQEVTAFKEEEERLRDSNTQAEAASDEVVAMSGEPLLGQEVRNLSGWRAYGFARGRVMQAAQQFPAYYTAARENASITIDGEVITFDSPDLTSAQYAALQQEVISGYLSSFAGVNPALLNEYLFPTVSRYAANESATWAVERAEEIEIERKEQRLDDLVVDLQSGNASAASNYILNHPEGPRAGKTELAAQLAAGLENGTLDPDLVQEIMDSEITFNDGSVGTLAGRDPRIFGGLQQGIDDARDNDLTRDERALEREEREFSTGVQQLANSGHTFTQDDVDGIEEWYEERGRAVPAYVATLKTAQTLDDNDQRRRLDAILASQGYLFEQDLALASPAVKAEYAEAVAAGQAVQSITDKDRRAANAATEAALNAVFDITDPDALKNSNYLAAQRDLLRQYEGLYAEGFTRYGDAQQAQEYAIGQIEKLVAANPEKYFNYTSGQNLDEETSQNIDAGRTGLLENMDSEGNLSPDYILPNSQEARAQAYAFVVNGKGSLPTLYTMLARGQGFSALDLARQQLSAANMLHEEVTPPEELGLTPQVQDLLTRYPSTANTSRAVIESSATTSDKRWFLDKVASVESAAHGEYDAMNTGGSGWGTENTAYGSANSRDVFDRGLSEMTLGEVMELQRNGKVFAAGRYQFIPETLIQTAQELGLGPDTPFNAATQDALAIGRLRWRLSVDNSMNGLQTEWQGFFFLPDSEVQRTLKIARTLVASGEVPQSPYNEPANLVPGVLTG